MRCRKLKYISVFVLLFLCFYNSVSADSTSVKRFKFYPFPAIGYSPETRWYVGAVTLFNFRTGSDTLLKPASAQLEFNITQNKQWILTADFDVRFKKDLYLLTGSNGYYDYPEYYWEQGITSEDDEKFIYESKRLELDNAFYRKVLKNTLVGIRYRYHQNRIDSSDISLFPAGTKSFQTASGIGAALLFDSRNVLFYPKKGWYISLSAIFFDEAFGGNYQFEKIDADVRAYMKLKNKGVFAWQFVSQNTISKAPFRMLPALGGENIMRGYYFGRFRDEQMVSTQLEYRQEIYKRFGAVAFLGTGTVYTFDKNNSDPIILKPNYGLGFRFTIDKKDHVNLRVDYGFGKDMNGLYISFGEAF